MSGGDAARPEIESYICHCGYLKTTKNQFNHERCFPNMPRPATPLATASAELAEKGTPLVADDAVCLKCEGIIDSPLVNARCNCHKPTVKKADVRTFDTGATRDTAEGKSEHVGFNSPLADKRFGEFMHLHRLQSDGELRESSNWKRGIPKQAYIESLGRHFLELRLMYDGHDVEGTDVETTLCAIRFNTNGFLHEILKEKTS